MQAAQNTGMKIFLGLYFDESWNSSNKNLSSTYNTNAVKHKEVIDELWGLFGSNPALQGWYVPQEINDLEWQSVTSRNLLASWLQDVASYAKLKDPSKKILIAPFFGPHRPADDLQSWWNAVLGIATDVDIVAPQDGVGTTTKDVDVDIPHYFLAIKNACLSNGVTFASTIESFQQTNGWPINANPFTAIPADITRFTSQLREAGRHTTQMYQFEWPYMQPGLSIASQQLYNDYKAYAFCAPLSIDFDIDKSEEILSKGHSIKIFPVPIEKSGKLIISFKDIIIYELEIQSIEGKVISNYKIDPYSDELTIEIDISDEGIYFLKIKHEAGYEIRKLVVQ